MECAMSLVESARQWVLQTLPYDRADTALVAHLNALDAHGLLVVYHNWMSRRVKPQPRTVVKSKAFQQNPLTAQRASDLAQIIADIEQGRDLTKYLSRQIERAVGQASGQPPRPDIDWMLNDWRVYHLHISIQIDPDGFVTRHKQKNADEPLLFAAFQQQTAYMIDIMKHGDWTRDHVLEVLATEWPNEGVIHEVKGVLGLSNPITEEQRATRKHPNSAFEFRGKVFMPIGFMSATGTTMEAGREADKLLVRIAAFERELIRNPKVLKPEFERHGLAFPEAPEFEFAIREDGYGVIETKTHTWVNLAGNQRP
jgi:hypothetical protein